MAGDLHDSEHFLSGALSCLWEGRSPLELKGLEGPCRVCGIPSDPHPAVCVAVWILKLTTKAQAQWMSQTGTAPPASPCAHLGATRSRGGVAACH